MSKKTKLVNSLLHTSAEKLGGAHLSRQKRDGFCRRFAKSVIDAGYKDVGCIADLRMRHVNLIIQNPKKLKPRTIANQLSFLRALLREGGGNRQLIQQLDVPNAELGVPKGSRKGTGHAPNADEYAQMLQKAKSPELNAVLRLERTIGLRDLEALRSDRSLKGWLADLRANRRIEVTYGTKGGRCRHTYIPDTAAAIDAIQNALAVIGNGTHIAPKDNLKQAITWYRNATHRLGIKGHGLRYAFAHEGLDRYLAEGKSLRDALARMAMDLGHCDGRGRWIKLVYCQQKLFASGQSV